MCRYFPTGSNILKQRLIARKVFMRLLENIKGNMFLLPLI